MLTAASPRAFTTPVAALLRTLGDYAGSHRDKILKASSVEGHIFDNLSINDGTDRSVRCVEQGRPGLDCNARRVHKRSRRLNLNSGYL